MKKSERYQIAMITVIDSDLPAPMKLEIIETLLDNKSTAEWCEQREEDAK